MGDKDLNSYDVLLMINQDTGSLFPFSSHGFHFAQGSTRSIGRRSSHDVFLDSQGCVVRISEILPRSNDLIAKIKEVLGFPYEINVKTELQSIELPTLKNLVLEGMRDFKSKLDGDESWKFAVLPISDIETSISTVEDAKSLYEVLALPNAVDCLDQL